MAAGGHGGRAHKLSRAEERRRGDVGRAATPALAVGAARRRAPVTHLHAAPRRDATLHKTAIGATPSRPDQRRRHPEEYPVPDPKDATTPDAWVKRAPELVRLTGRHPFNVEPPLPMLIAHGHATPASLHYVRNHGKVPVVYSEATADRVDDGHSSAQNPLKISPALFPPSKDASFIAVAAPTARYARRHHVRTIISKQLVNLTQSPDPRRRRRDRLAHVDLHADVVCHRSFAVP